MQPLPLSSRLTAFNTGELKNDGVHPDFNLLEWQSGGVASIADAAKALQQPWPSMDKPVRLEAIRMIEECLAGHCSHQAAFAAFEAAASEQGLLEQKPPSAGLRKFDGVAEDLM
ncbi:MAG: DUF982 domain-containing protein [Mesorhizobium sp.]|uniref:DUF982 domain-containing protein n=1 Tax=Mesorhizobium sp. TaxID=1871066 RepID=UPI000FE86070|nr:DUF982 domain-containing protein [Mesorhizobium sp.]RWK57141.1 MAG: DUF982 domain-containing protein [Mesorhizobium sp.]TIP46242.1 MAG: DUF982 domain-containing protein [Mesorhizobium sp.]TJX01333.1 MAG: DUF982 domain-containing protein [Mesorhizobium sp.]